MSVLRVNNIDTAGLLDVVTNGVVEKRALPSGSVLQVVQVVKTDTQASSVASQGTVTINGLSAEITPSSTSNKILVTFNVSAAVGTAALALHAVLVRNGTPRTGAINASPGSRRAATTGIQSINGRGVQNMAMTFLDTVTDLSTNTYTISLSHNSGSTQTVVVNRDVDNINDLSHAYYISSITLMEIAG